MDESTLIAEPADATLPGSEDVSLAGPVERARFSQSYDENPSIPSRSGRKSETSTMPRGRAVLYRYSQDAIAAIMGAQSWTEYNDIVQANTPHLSNAWFAKNLQEAQQVVDHVVRSKQQAEAAAFKEKADSFSGQMLKKTATAFADKVSQIDDADFMMGTLPGIIKRSQQNGEMSQEDLAAINGAVAKSNEKKSALADKPLGATGKDLHDELAFLRSGGTKAEWDAAAKSRARTGVGPTDIQLLEGAKKYREEGNIEGAKKIEDIVTEHGRNKSPAARTINLQVGIPGTPDSYTESMTPEEFKKRPITDPNVLKKLGEYSDLKAKIDTGKGETHGWYKSDVETAAALKSELKAGGIDADTRKRIVPGPDSPAPTNAPAASAPASASTGLQEGQRVRSRVTGKFGTVKNGIVVPDPEAAQ